MLYQLPEHIYAARVRARASQLFHPEHISRFVLMATLRELVDAGDQLDQIKKALFYGKPIQDERLSSDIETRSLVAETWPQLSAVDVDLIHAILGVITEASELAIALVHRLEHKPFDRTNLLEEFGDVNWYRVLGLSTLNQTEDENRLMNDQKLETRFGPAFRQKSAIERDLAAERAVLENSAEPDQKSLDSSGDIGNTGSPS